MQKNTRFFQTLFCFSFNFLDSASHKFWEQSPHPNDQCWLQVSKKVSWRKLRCCYSSNMVQHWVEERGLTYSEEWTIPEFPEIFSRNWLDLKNLCEILLNEPQPEGLKFLCQRNFLQESFCIFKSRNSKNNKMTF